MLRALPPRWRAAVLIVVLLALTASIVLVVRFTSDEPVAYADIGEHFKYGSTGGERASGIPYSLWQSLPDLFRKYLPGAYDAKAPYAVFGFLYEPGKDLPIGVSRRRVQGLDRVFVNCAACHVGSVRDTPQSERRIILGMPANTVDLQAFQRFLFACATDEEFTPRRLALAVRRREDPINRLALRAYGFGVIRERLLLLRQRFLSFMEREPDTGPGRVDTFNPPKILLNFRMDRLPPSEWVGNVDLPSIWLQRPRADRRMRLHWDGNNDSVQERNRSAAFGTGAYPATLDREGIRRVEDWLLDVTPAPYPYPIDSTRAARGQSLYDSYCASCHGKDGRDFSGDKVGTVEPIELIGTDRHRLDSYTHDLAANQGLLYAGYPEERFKRFRKTFGYANMPLDGLWLRAPYLHNGSVPTLRDLLEPAARRPATFYRGYDVYDPRRVGFVGDVAEEAGRRFFRFDTGLPGNGNAGHEGPAYGTSLPPGDKDAIVEYLKTF